MKYKRLLVMFCISIFTVIIYVVWTNIASSAVIVTDIKFLGEAIIPTGSLFQNTEIGGLSGITYDEKNRVYYSISDDRGSKAPTRFYTLTIDLSAEKLNDKNVKVVGVTNLLNQDNQIFAPGTTDTEGIALTNRDTIFVSSEGDVEKSVNPFISEFDLVSGKIRNSLNVEKRFLPDTNKKQGIRNNLGFESLTITPNQEYLYTATENALIQDGTAAKEGIGTSCRILQYNLVTQQPTGEFLYQTEPVTSLFNPTGKFASGLPDLVALDNQGHFLSIERSFTGLGFTILLFEVSLDKASNIQNLDSVVTDDRINIKPVEKKLILDLRSLDVSLDNIEGLTLGAKLADGQRSLILISDNNFNRLQKTQILGFKLQIESPWTRLLRRLGLGNSQ
ncbi:esterase-like activity of phytase family protein [Anabaena sp. FACHB-1237]|uniref:esterase-like activity of phytase family protein n=1 Tax=Anabaena sp. FACHB-1237 TaxID=2692769 RepID=UPI001F54D23D|nr:esterase-like activity of phytase family protein [Anabaena sp. FACHB-1237]